MIEPNIAKIAALLGEPTRAKMVTALMGGKALTATELAIEADITAQTASSHLAKLVDRNLLRVQKQGRHKYFQLSDYKIAELIESLLNVSAGIEHSKVVTGPKDPELRESRICYDHLAGEVGVKLLDSMKVNGVFEVRYNELALTEKGSTFFIKMGVDIEELKQKKRPLCKHCLDWSERRHHLAGSIGKWILDDILKNGWAKKDLNNRVIRFSSHGRKALNKAYKLTAMS